MKFIRNVSIPATSVSLSSDHFIHNINDDLSVLSFSSCFLYTTPAPTDKERLFMVGNVALNKNQFLFETLFDMV